MNIFLYGMQSSGASLTTFFLGQLPRSVCVIDVWNHVRLPDLEDARSTSDHVIAKCVVTETFGLRDHLRSFRPDVKLLVLRHPLHNYVSLRRRPWANKSGCLDEKFRRIEQIFRGRSSFDHVMIYEDLAFRQKDVVRQLNDLSIPMKMSYFDFPRSKQDIVAFNKKHSAWCRSTYGTEWGHTGLHGSALRRRDLFKVAGKSTREHVKRLCPTVYDFMEDHYRRHVPRLHRTVLPYPVHLVKGMSRPVRKLRKAAVG